MSSTTETPKEEKPSGTYECGCHCGYIKFAVTLSPPLSETKVNNCSCSACTRFGYLLICTWLSLLSFEFSPACAFSFLFTL
jgi:hypothetical protein